MDAGIEEGSTYEARCSMTKRKHKKTIPHFSELPPDDGKFIFDLLPTLGKQDEQMREAMEILKQPWAIAVLNPEIDRHQAQIALANLIRKAYHLGYEDAKRAAEQLERQTKATEATKKLTDEERTLYIREAEALRNSDEKYKSHSLTAKVLMDRFQLHSKISHRQMRRIVGGK
jgi:hypothetical protein